MKQHSVSEKSLSHCRTWLAYLCAMILFCSIEYDTFFLSLPPYVPQHRINNTTMIFLWLCPDFPRVWMKIHYSSIGHYHSYGYKSDLCYYYKYSYRNMKNWKSAEASKIGILLPQHLCSSGGFLPLLQGDFHLPGLWISKSRYYIATAVDIAPILNECVPNWNPWRPNFSRVCFVKAQNWYFIRGMESWWTNKLQLPVPLNVK